MTFWLNWPLALDYYWKYLLNSDAGVDCLRMHFLKNLSVYWLSQLLKHSDHGSLGHYHSCPHLTLIWCETRAFSLHLNSIRAWETFVCFDDWHLWLHFNLWSRAPSVWLLAGLDGGWWPSLYSYWDRGCICDRYGLPMKSSKSLFPSDSQGEYYSAEVDFSCLWTLSIWKGFQLIL